MFESFFGREAFQPGINSRFPSFFSEQSPFDNFFSSNSMNRANLFHLIEQAGEQSTDELNHNAREDRSPIIFQQLFLQRPQVQRIIFFHN